jgi:hypothetical protein
VPNPTRPRRRAGPAIERSARSCPPLSARSACRVATKYSVALRIASAASRLLGFVAGREAAAGVFSLSSCPVFRQPAVVSDPGNFGFDWSRAVVVAWQV